MLVINIAHASYCGTYIIVMYCSNQQDRPIAKIRMHNISVTDD